MESKVSPAEKLINTLTQDQWQQLTNTITSALENYARECEAFRRENSIDLTDSLLRKQSVQYFFSTLTVSPSVYDAAKQLIKAIIDLLDQIYTHKALTLYVREAEPGNAPWLMALATIADRLTELYVPELYKRSQQSLHRLAQHHGRLLRERLNHEISKLPSIKLTISKESSRHQSHGKLFDNSFFKRDKLKNHSWSQLRQRLKSYRQTLFENSNKQILSTLPALKVYTEKMNSLVNSLCERVEFILGDAPCAYSILGMGSFARAELCPYSDLEFALIYQNDAKKTKYYFQAFVEALELQVIGLGESAGVLYNLNKMEAIPVKFNFLNSTDVHWCLPTEVQPWLPISKGFCFDEGNNVPTRKIELLGTSQQIIDYNTNITFGDQITASAIHEAWMICGDHELNESFQNLLKAKLNKINPVDHLSIRFCMAQRLLAEHCQDFVNRFNEADGVIDIKKHLLRLAVFTIKCISLGFNIPARTSQERLTELLKLGHLTKPMERALIILLNLGFQWRIRLHHYYQTEEDRAFLNKADIVPKALPFPYYLTPDQLLIFTPLYDNVIRLLEETVITFTTQWKSPDVDGHAFQTLKPPALAPIYIEIGRSYVIKGNFSAAFTNYKQAIFFVANEATSEASIALASRLNEDLKMTQKALARQKEVIISAKNVLLKCRHLKFCSWLKSEELMPPPKKRLEALVKRILGKNCDQYSSLLEEGEAIVFDKNTSAWIHLKPDKISISWIHLIIATILTIRVDENAKQLFHDFYFRLNYLETRDALIKEWCRWRAIIVASSKTQRRLIQRCKIIQNWQEQWNTVGIRMNVSRAWQDVWHSLDIVTEDHDINSPSEGVKQHKILLEWIKPQDGILYYGSKSRKYLHALKEKFAHSFLTDDGQLIVEQPLLEGKRVVIPMCKPGDEVPIFYAKFYPEFPGIQLAVDGLCQLVSGISSQSVLALLYIRKLISKQFIKKSPRLKKIGRNQNYIVIPVLLSKALPAGSIHRLLKTQPKLNQLQNHLNQRDFTLKIIETLLLHPEDDKADNLGIITNSDNSISIISFDCDHAFVTDILQQAQSNSSNRKMILQLKSLLLCFDAMTMPLNVCALREFLDQKPEVIITRWLRYLDHLDKQLFGNEQFSGLIARDELYQYYKDSNNSCFLPISFTPGVIANLYQRWRRLRIALQQPIENHIQLMQLTHPYLTIIYKKAFMSADNPAARFNALPTDYKTIFDENNEMVNYISEFNMRQRILRSITIKDSRERVNSKRAIIDGGLFSWRDALLELSRTMNYYKSVLEFKKQLQESNIEEFSELEYADDIKETVFNIIDFNAIEPIDRYSIKEIQVNILNVMIGVNFRELRITDCNALTTAHLKDLLEKSPDLVRLEINNCPNIDSSVANYLAKCCPAIEKIYLSQLPKVSKIIKFSSIKKMITFQKLHTLHVQNCNINFSGTKDIINLISRNSSITDVNLRDNCIPQRQVIQIIKLLKNRSVFGDINCNFSGNDFRVASTERIFQLPKTCISYQRSISLDLSYCNSVIELTGLIKEYGWLFLNLQILNLTGNDLNSESFSILFDSLPNIAKLRILILEKCGLNVATMNLLVQRMGELPLLQELNLSQNHFGDKCLIMLANHFNKMTKLRVLKLRNCSASETGIIFSSLKLNNLVSLEQFDVGENFIGQSHAGLLAMNFSNCSKLDVFSVNKLTIIDYLKRDHSTRVDMSNKTLNDRDFSVFSFFLSSFPKLREIHLDNNKLTKFSMNYLSKSLKNMKNIQVITLSNNKICDDGITILSRGLSKLVKLRRLNLNGNCIGDSGIMPLIKIFKVTSSLQILELCENNISSVGLELLARKLKNLPYLTNLNLANNLVMNEGIEVLVRCFKNIPLLQNMNISSCTISSSKRKEFIKQLSDLKRLEILNINNCSLKILGSYYLSKYLYKINLLVSLNIASNNMGNAGVTLLANNFDKINFLETLNLNNNRIGIGGAITLAENIKSLPCLTFLSLKKNYIGNTGLHYLSKAFKNTSILLRSLNLENNAISYTGIYAFSKYLKYISSLQTLNLADNFLRVSGIKILSKHFKKIRQLTELNLWGNRICDEGISFLSEHIVELTNLETLNIEYNNITKEGFRKLIPRLNENVKLQQLFIWGNELGPTCAKKNCSIYQASATYA